MHFYVILCAIAFISRVSFIMESFFFSSVPDHNLVLAKRGTLKRSRQIQNAMKEMDVGYSADAFAEATPLKSNTRIQV